MTTIRFGRDFELDPKAYELRRGGRPVRLERIPMEILLLLVESRGHLVTRQQIIGRVWGEGVFVDTDNNINAAIRKLRQALRDDAENPRFIGTVTSKGYRFIAPLSEAQPLPVAPLPIPTESPDSSPVPIPAARTSSPGRWLGLVSTLALVGTLGVYLLGSRSPSPPPAGRRVMLAVLPFENLTGDAGQDYFSDGLTEEIISRVGNLAPQQLGVIARTSVMYYKQERAPLDKLGRELGVQYVLEGSVRRNSERLRITAQLIHVKDQTHVWARQYDREAAEVLIVQAEIAHAISDLIELTLGTNPAPPPKPAALSAQGLEAYDHYLKGLYYWNKRSEEGFTRAISHFQQAIASNPDEARAYAGLANTYALLGTYGLSSHADVIPKAREAALEALQIDERLAAAHTALALINELFDRDWQTAESRFRRAIELDLNYVTAHHWYAEHLAFQGRFDEALAESERARLLDPLSPIIAADHGAILYFARQYERAIQQFQLALAMDPRLGRAHLIIAVYAQQGKFDEALAQITEFNSVNEGPWVWAWAAYVYGRSGRQAEAEQALQKMEESNRPRRYDPLMLCATAHVGMGNTDEALSCLQRACEESPGTLASVKVDPIFDPLRDDPRFQEVLRCEGLAQ